MPKNAIKAQKKIRQKRGSNANSLHENSRDAQMLRRASAREDKLAQITARRAKLNRPHSAKEAKEPFTIDSIRSLIQMYLHRDDKELSKLRGERRPGRPSSTKEDMLKQRIETEKKEFETGFNIPDMEDAKNVEALLGWTGEWSALSRTFLDGKNIKVVFSIADLNTLDTDSDRYDDPALYDEEGDGQSGGAQSKGATGRPRSSNVSANLEDKAASTDGQELAEDEADGGLGEDQEPSFPARVNITIEKAGQGAMQIETVAQDGMIVIDNVYYYSSPELADAKTAEKDWERRSMYTGPPFGNLDEDLQVLLERYLDERGVNTALALFIPDYIDHKEQREYISWLSNVRSFVEA
ncbi:hypothetical protein FGG08_004906 [Glutinoglossum americanum]|uniref:Uncharacterized protein n=1 Tax=Glutinoglossum americanum TaxID=1670608 RepID=A0A9P8I1E8_9PEZI|nr:hypothetical protein FGG08_004906 [Glutinoglossum americanum]